MNTYTEKKISEHRITYVDVMKGFAILLVCLGHCFSSHAYPLNRWLYSFHMPLFFFITGFLLEKRLSNPWKKYIGKNFFSLAVPEITLVVFEYFSLVLLRSFIVKSVPVSQIRFFDFKLAWFLPTLFCMNMLLYFLFKLSLLSSRLRYITLVCFMTVFFFLPVQSGFLLQIICACVFGLAGLLTFPLVKRWEKHKKLHGIGFPGMILCAVLSFYNTPIAMYINEYGCRLFFLLTAMIGIFSVIDIAMLLKDASFLEYFGRNSIIIYVTHLPLMPFLHAFYRHFISKDAIEYPYFLIMFLLLTLAESFVIPTALRMCPILFGIRTNSGKT